MAIVLRGNGESTFSNDVEIDGTITNDLTIANDLTLTDGNLVVADGHGIDFSATGTGTGTDNVNELLSDYETGTFTPSIADAMTGGNVVAVGDYQRQTGFYTKIGRLVNLSIDLNRFDRDGLTAANQLWVIGFPFAVSAGNIYIGTAGLDNFTVNDDAYTAYAFVNATAVDQTGCRLFIARNGDSHTHCNVNTTTADNSSVMVNITYWTN